MLTQLKTIMNKTRKKQKLSLLICWAILLIGEIVFFRNVLTNDLLFGDNGDGRLTMLFTEHWYHVFTGQQSLANMGFFYPVTNTLGYSDIFFTFGLLHTLLRFLGCDVFIAFKTTLMLVHLFGTYSCFYYLKRQLKVNSFWSLFGTMAFSFSPSYALHLAHTQLFTLSFLPVQAIFITQFFQDFSNTKNLKFIKNHRLAPSQKVAAYASLITFALILYNAWYIAFFIILGACVTMLILILYALINYSRKEWRYHYQQFVIWLVKNSREIGIFLISAFALMLPFVILELPVLHMAGGYNYKDLLRHLPEPIDLINVTPQNFAIGKFISKLYLVERQLSMEVEQGYSLIVWLTFIVLLIEVIKNQHRQKKNYLLASTIIIANIILCLKLSSNGVSFWYFIYHFFPGGHSVRAVGRYLLFLSFPLSVVIALMGHQLTADKKIKHRLCYQVLLLSLLFVFNQRRDGAVAVWHGHEKTFIEEAATQPASCQAFFMVNPDPNSKSANHSQIDAYQLSDKFLLPTINGYSGQEPPNWHPIVGITNKTYLSAVYSWIKSHQLQHLCIYDQVNNSWQVYDEKQQLTRSLDTENNIAPMLMSGVYEWSDDYAWTLKDVSVTVQDPEITKQGLLLKYGTSYNRYRRQQSDVEPEFKIFVNNTLVKTIKVTSDEIKEIVIPVAPTTDNIYEIHLESNFFFNPKQLGDSKDDRDLSLQLYYIGAPSGYQETAHD